MIDISQLTSLVSAFRVETEKESISPETVGKLLQDIVDLLATGDREVEMHDFYIPDASQGSAGVMTATHVKQLDALRQEQAHTQLSKPWPSARVSFACQPQKAQKGTMT